MQTLIWVTSQLFFPGEGKTISLLKAFAVTP